MLLEWKHSDSANLRQGSLQHCATFVQSVVCKPAYFRTVADPTRGAFTIANTTMGRIFIPSH